jgi:hypothetical protein
LSQPTLFTQGHLLPVLNIIFPFRLRKKITKGLKPKQITHRSRFHRMLQTSVALSRKHSQDRRHQQNAVDELLGPRENSQLALLDCSNLSLG